MYRRGVTRDREPLFPRRTASFADRPLRRDRRVHYRCFGCAEKREGGRRKAMFIPSWKMARLGPSHCKTFAMPGKGHFVLNPMMAAILLQKSSLLRSQTTSMEFSLHEVSVLVNCDTGQVGLAGSSHLVSSNCLSHVPAMRTTTYGKCLALRDVWDARIGTVVATAPRCFQPLPEHSFSLGSQVVHRSILFSFCIVVVQVIA